MKQIIYQVCQVSMRCAIFLIFSFSHFLILTTGAQSFTQQLQKTEKGKGTVTLHQDKSIDALVNGSAVNTTPAPPKPVVTVPATNKNKAKENKEEKKPAVQQQEERQDHVKNDTVAQERNSIRTYKTTGFRVQAFAGGNSRKDRQKAERTGNELRALFPNEQVYTHFYAPRWICRIGNYRTYEEAHQMLQEVKKLGYSSATIVKGKISVPY